MRYKGGRMEWDEKWDEMGRGRGCEGWGRFRELV